MDDWTTICLVLLQNRRQYEATIKKNWTCICLGFVNVVANLFDQWRKWVPYKHLYYELQDVMFCGEFEIFLHFPTWSCDEVCHLLDRAITFKWWFTFRNDIQSFMKKCVKMYYVRQYKWFKSSLESLVLVVSWDYFFMYWKHVQYLISYYLTFKSL
jgi:hypothetical protein